MADEPGGRAFRARAPRIGPARADEKAAGPAAESASPPVGLGNQALQRLALDRSLPPPARPGGIGDPAAPRLVRDGERAEPWAALATRLGNQAFQRVVARALSGRSTPGAAPRPVVQLARREDLQPAQAVVFPDMVVLPGNWWIKPGTLARVVTVPPSGDIVIRIESGEYAKNEVKVDPRHVEIKNGSTPAPVKSDAPEKTTEAMPPKTGPAIPDAPTETKGTAPPWKGRNEQESYRQVWVVGEVSCTFSSGHGYRKEHKPGGPDVTKVGAMNEIERAILADLSSIVGGLATKKPGERTVTVNGSVVAYRYNKFGEKNVGVGTYFIPG